VILGAVVAVTEAPGQASRTRPRPGAPRAPQLPRSSDHDGDARRRAQSLALWFFRVLPITPFVLMGPQLIAALQGRPGAVGNISASTADVFGTSSFLIFAIMLTITPVHTLTGWTWHIPLRRYYGVAMFLTATADLILAATTTGDTFSGGVLGRIGGRTFLVAGTLAVVLLVPLALTSFRRSHEWLGSYWRRLHRLVFVIWAVILIHLLFLFGFRGTFLDALVLSIPLAVLRLPPVRRWWSAARRSHQHEVPRVVLLMIMCGMFAAGFVPLVRELAFKGAAAFMQHPVS
jgi:methionine sulfoxide reductase heme-binding subunit